MNRSTGEDLHALAVHMGAFAETHGGARRIQFECADPFVLAAALGDLIIDAFPCTVAICPDVPGVVVEWQHTPRTGEPYDCQVVLWV